MLRKSSQRRFPRRLQHTNLPKVLPNVGPHHVTPGVTRQFPQSVVRYRGTKVPRLKLAQAYNPHSYFTYSLPD